MCGAVLTRCSWFSMNCTANQLTLGVLGPVSYGLGLTDSILICMFGTIFGSVCTGYISTFGPRSGLRTLNVAKYTMGWWPSKLCVILNLAIEIGYGLIDCLVGGLLLSAVNGGGMSVIVGIVIVALITWVVVTFGIKYVRHGPFQTLTLTYADGSTSSSNSSGHPLSLSFSSSSALPARISTRTQPPAAPAQYCTEIDSRTSSSSPRAR